MNKYNYLPVGIFAACAIVFTAIHFISMAEPKYEYRVSYESCTGLQDTITTEGWGTGLAIDNSGAVPELVAKGGAAHRGHTVAYNVCDFTILSKTPVK